MPLAHDTSMQARESSAEDTRKKWEIAGYVADPAIMREVDRLLAGRTRDIRLTGALNQAFQDRTWRQTAKIIRSWMIWVVVLDFLTLSMNFFMIPRAAAISMIAPGAVIPLASLAVFLVWRKQEYNPIQNWMLSSGVFLILLAVCLMGAAAGGQWQERYLYVMLFVAIAGITTFSVPMRHTWIISGSCLLLFFLFQLDNPLVAQSEAISTFFFFACGVTAVVVARRTMDLLAKKGFLLELRAGARLEALTGANKRLDRLTKIDPLTGVANRRQVSEVLEALVSCPTGQRQGTSILMCDIDCFKALNDRLGHAEGDRSLVEVARIIESSVRVGADLVARYGGEEFLVILPDTSAADAMVVAERIRAGVGGAQVPNPLSSVAPFVTVSIGAASRSRTQVWTSDELLWEADTALYRAKEAGRNATVLFDALGLGPSEKSATLRA